MSIYQHFWERGAMAALTGKQGAVPDEVHFLSYDALRGWSDGWSHGFIIFSENEAR